MLHALVYGMQRGVEGDAGVRKVHTVVAKAAATCDPVRIPRGLRIFMGLDSHCRQFYRPVVDSFNESFNFALLSLGLAVNTL